MPTAADFVAAAPSYIIFSRTPNPIEGEVDAKQFDDSAFVSLGDFAFIFDNASNINVTGITFQHARQGI